MPRRHPYKDPRTIIRMGAAAYDATITATDRASGERVHNHLELGGFLKSTRRAREEHRPCLSEVAKAVCQLHGIRYGRKRKGALPNKAKPEGDDGSPIRKAIRSATMATMERTAQHMPMGA